MSIVVICKYMGVLLSVMGLGYLLNPKHITDLVNDLKSSSSITVILGIIPLIIGLTIVLHVPLTSTGIHLILAVLGVVILLEGMLTLVFPKFYMSIVEFIINTLTPRVFSILIFLLGLIFVYHSFFK